MEGGYKSTSVCRFANRKLREWPCGRSIGVWSNGEDEEGAMGCLRRGEKCAVVTVESQRRWALVAVLRVPFVGADYGFRPVSLACCQRSGCHMDSGPKEMVVYKFGILPEVKTREVRESQD